VLLNQQLNKLHLLSLKPLNSPLPSRQLQLPQRLQLRLDQLQVECLHVLELLVQVTIHFLVLAPVWVGLLVQVTIRLVALALAWVVTVALAVLLVQLLRQVRVQTQVQCRHVRVVR
jgi:hypothetical protein